MRKLIGKGQFSRAYQIGPNEVELISCCVTKECYAMFSQGNSFAPEIDMVDSDCKGNGIYHMPLYPRVKAPKQQLNEKSYSLYKILREISGECRGYDKFRNAVECMDIDEDVKEELQSLAGDVCNGISTRNVCFEISPRNITHDENGNLIMLDCFFDITAKSYK